MHRKGQVFFRQLLKIGVLASVILEAFSIMGGSRITSAGATVLFEPTTVFAASDPNCQPVLDANNKTLATPYHSYTIASGALSGGPPMKSEAILIDRTLYMQVNGKWEGTSMTEQDLKDLAQSGTTPSSSCQHLRDESVNGESAALYSTHSTSERATSDQQVWISKSRGLILRSEIDVVVKPKGSKAHMSISYDYTNVHKPKI